MNYDAILNRKKEKETIKYSEIKLDLLTTEQIFGDNQLEIFKKYGTKAAITDFSVALGGYINDQIFTDDGKLLTNRTCGWWTKTPIHDDARAVYWVGSMLWSNVTRRNGGCRPALPFSLISKISSNNVMVRNDLLEVEYGEYPQWICSKQLGKTLEKLYISNSLSETGKCYTTDSRHYDEYDEDFEPQEHIEYEYNGKKYIRVIVNSYYDGEEVTFSDGEKYKDGDFIWIEVSPIKWLVDEVNDIAITKNIIVSGIQFNIECNYNGKNFDEMNIKKFMDNYLSKEIIANNINYKNLDSNTIFIDNIEDKKQKYLKKYGLDEESIKKFRGKIHYDEFQYESDFNDLVNSIENNDIKKSKKLICEGVNVNIITNVSLLDCAIEEKNLDMAILLLKAGHRIDIGEMLPALNNDMYELCKIMILMGADLTEEDDLFDETIIDVARSSKKEKYIKLFESAINGDYSIIFDEDKIKYESKTEKEILQTGIEEMGKMLESCEDLLGDNYQKVLKKR